MSLPSPKDVATLSYSIFFLPRGLDPLNHSLLLLLASYASLNGEYHRTFAKTPEKYRGDDTPLLFHNTPLPLSS
jgi:hypothetical protein